MNPYKNTESIYFSPLGEAEGGDELEEVRQALDEVMRARYEGTSTCGSRLFSRTGRSLPAKAS